MVAVCAAFLLGGWFLKAQCLDPWSDSHQYESLCYNDIQALYQVRGIQDRTFPYVHGSFDSANSELVDGAIEYPVLTGLFMYAAGAGVTDANGYLGATALLLAPFGLLIAYLLGRLEGLRALMWAASPALILYSFHNWDLLVVAAVVVGFYVYRRDQPLVAAALFGVGAALEDVPRLLRTRARRRLAGAPGGEGRTRSRRGWRRRVRADQPPLHRRQPGRLVGDLWVPPGARSNFDNIWTLLPDMTPDDLNLVTGGLTLIGFGIALGIGTLRARREGVFPTVPVCAVLLAAFMLFSKVHSPQYTLWLLPFFVLVRVNLLWWIAYAAADLLVYVGVFRFFYDLSERTGGTLAEDAMELGIWFRAALLALFVVFLTSSATPPDRFVSQPLPTVDPVGGAELSASEP